MISLHAPILTDFVATITNLGPVPTEVLLGSASAGVLSAIMAKRKARSAYRWFILGLLLNVFGLAAILLLPSRFTHARCPQCHGIVPISAPTCMYCHIAFIQPKNRWQKIKRSISV